jgi:hypothetical protein
MTFVHQLVKGAAGWWRSHGPAHISEGSLIGQITFVCPENDIRDPQTGSKASCTLLQSCKRLARHFLISSHYLASMCVVLIGQMTFVLCGAGIACTTCNPKKQLIRQPENGVAMDEGAC